jgi:hypothetical protein
MDLHFEKVKFFGIKKNEMGWACGTYERHERHIQGFGGEP